jgi:opacity protein-like surface antigen
MHRISLGLVLGVLLVAAPLAAQRPSSAATAGDTPRVEISLGYSPVVSRTVISTGCCFRMNGGSASVAANVNRWLGFVGDVGGYYTGNAGSGGFTLSVISYTFGPRVSFRRSSRFTPYVQGLFGGARAGGTLYTLGFQQGSTIGPRNAFAMLLGGGLDINVNHRFAIRAIQADWLFTKFPNGGTNRQNNVRLTAGIVFRFGGK